MTITHTKAPDIPNPSYPNGGYPTKGRKIGPAWQAAWRAMEKAGDFLDGKELSEKIAPKHDLSPQTLVAILSRAEVAGLLVKEPRPVEVSITRTSGTTVGHRTRVFYRIKP
jgi:hypothetical protein